MPTNHLPLILLVAAPCGPRVIPTPIPEDVKILVRCFSSMTLPPFLVIPISIERILLTAFLLTSLTSFLRLTAVFQPQGHILVLLLIITVSPPKSQAKSQPPF